MLASARGAAEISLGTDDTGHAVALRPFQQTATRIGLIGDYWLAYVLTWRALEAGARVVVVSADLSAWEAFQDSLPRSLRRLVRTHPPGADVSGDLGGPVLVVDDQGALAEGVPRGPGVAVITLCPELVPEAVPMVRACEFVVLHRLEVEEARMASLVLGLSETEGERLVRLPRDVVAVLAGGSSRLVQVTPSEAEAMRFGGARD